jgi:DNA-binding winged helix-turn-helix (wHTH) protein
MDPSSPPTFTINGFVADLGSETLRDRKGNVLALRAQTFKVLRHLLVNSGRLVTKDELIETVWPTTAVTDDSIVQCIHEIRRALKDDAHAILKTVPRRGYRLVLPTKAANEAARPSLLATSIAGVLLIIAGAAVSWWILRPPPMQIGKPVVAVLPFDNHGGSEATGRLAEGLTEDLIIDLARFPEFQVIARDSVQKYAGRSNSQASVVGPMGPVTRGSLRCPDRDLRAGFQSARRRRRRDPGGRPDCGPPQAAKRPNSLRAVPVRHGKACKYESHRGRGVHQAPQTRR